MCDFRRRANIILFFNRPQGQARGYVISPPIRRKGRRNFRKGWGMGVTWEKGGHPWEKCRAGVCGWSGRVSGRGEMGSPGYGWGRSASESRGLEWLKHLSTVNWRHSRRRPTQYQRSQHPPIPRNRSHLIPQRKSHPPIIPLAPQTTDLSNAPSHWLVAFQRR